MAVADVPLEPVWIEMRRGEELAGDAHPGEGDEFPQKGGRSRGVT